MKKYFITGATGVVGSALIPLLLADSEAELTLLIRADDHAHLERRMDELLDFCGFWDHDEHRRRVSAAIGDASLQGFGMEEHVFREVAQGTTHIIHAAGNVRMNLPIDDARTCSVGSARRIIELAELCSGLKKIEFVSTVGVGGRMPGVVPEDWVTLDRQFHNTYEQAKAEAEDYIRTCVDQGYPITVHRPSMVVGDSKTGKITHYQVFYYLCEFLSGKRTCGVTPYTAGATLDIVPSDYVASVIAWSSRTDSTIGRILHECSGKDAIPLSVLRSKVVDLYSGRGIKLPKAVCLPIAVFRSILPVIRLFASQRTRRAMKALPVFLSYLADSQSFDNQQTQALVGQDLQLPAVDQYLGTVLTSYLENR